MPLCIILFVVRENEKYFPSTDLPFVEAAAMLSLENDMTTYLDCNNHTTLTPDSRVFVLRFKGHDLVIPKPMFGSIKESKVEIVPIWTKRLFWQILCCSFPPFHP